MRLTLLIAFVVIAGLTIGDQCLTSNANPLWNRALAKRIALFIPTNCNVDADCPKSKICCPGQHSDSQLDSNLQGVCDFHCRLRTSNRPRRSIGLVARALGSIIKTLAQWYKRRGVGSSTSTGLRIVTRRGGYQQAVNDFNKFVSQSEIASVRQIRGGQVAIGKDGSRMIVRQRSSDGRPTLEMQNSNGRAIIKYRYDP